MKYKLRIHFDVNTGMSESDVSRKDVIKRNMKRIKEHSEMTKKFFENPLSSFKLTENFLKEYKRKDWFYFRDDISYYIDSFYKLRLEDDKGQMFLIYASWLQGNKFNGDISLTDENNKILEQYNL